tara:strand:- start:170 stop:328 length:159 start_codon:yes stop_codon:yes gene_type:complete
MTRGRRASEGKKGTRETTTENLPKIDREGGGERGNASAGATKSAGGIGEGGW